MTFYDIAKPMAERGIPQIRLRPRTKAAIDTDWPSLATLDLKTLEKLSSEIPEANAGSVAQAKIGGFWFFEADKPEVFQRMKAETGHELPPTLTVRSSPGRGHIYFRQSEASIKMGNLTQDYVKGGDWSARVNNQYVVTAGSSHPSGSVYEIRTEAEIIPAPQWFINWCIFQKNEKKEPIIVTDEEFIIEGGRNSRLCSIAGKLRDAGLDKEAIEAALLEVNRKRCQPPLDENEVRTIAGSVAKYPVGPDRTVLINGRPAGMSSIYTPQIVPSYHQEEVVPIEAVPYPIFPRWVMEGTSIYTGLVKPYCDENSRIPEFMFMPAFVILLNILSGKVRIQYSDHPLSIFLILIGQRGETHKSSSVRDAFTYFEFMGLASHHQKGMTNSDGRVVGFTVGSPEGFGIQMQKLNCAHGLLLFDEFATLVNKAKIDSSNLTAALLQLYESDKFENTIKNAKDSFSLPPRTYTASLIANSTDKNFLPNWAKLSGESSGLTDRFTFLYQPKILPEKDIFKVVNVQEGSVETRKLIDKAFAKGMYEIADTSPLKRFLKENKDAGRFETRAEKYALGFAVDLGYDEVTDDAIERGLALVKYEQETKRYIQTFDAETREGAIQMELLHHLQRGGGNIVLRDLYRIIHPERLGTSLWNSAYGGLIKAGWIREDGEGTKGSPKKLVLLRVPEEDD